MLHEFGDESFETYEQTNWKTFFGKLQSKLLNNEKRAMIFYCLDDTPFVFLLQKIYHFNNFVTILIHIRFSFPHHINKLTKERKKQVNITREYIKFNLELTGASIFSSIGKSTDIWGLKRKYGTPIIEHHARARSTTLPSANVA